MFTLKVQMVLFDFNFQGVPLLRLKEHLDCGPKEPFNGHFQQSQ